MRLRRAWIVLLSLIVALSPAAGQGSPPVCEIGAPADALNDIPLPPRDRADLAQRLLGFEPRPLPADSPDWQIADQKTFLVVNSDIDEVFEVEATLRVAGEHLLLWVETARSADVPDALLSAVVTRFDEDVYAQVRSLWGSEATPGVDGDPRIHGLVTSGLGSGAAAYFSSDNSAPRGTSATGNAHELFVFNLDVMLSAADVDQIVSIMAHEFQHMIRANVDPNLELWLNEGFSQFTETLLFGDPAYQALAFMTAPETQLNTWTSDPSLRVYSYGAALAFVTYFYDRFGLEALRQVSAMSDTQRGLTAFDRVLHMRGEGDIETFFADWVVTNVASDLIGDARYAYTTFPFGFTSAQPVQAVTLPFTETRTGNPFSARYLRVDGSAPFTITLEMPAELPLFDDDGANRSRVAYSLRGDMSDTRLTRAVDLTGVERADLTFRVWYDLEDAWDFGYVMASTDDGATWQILPGTHTGIPAGNRMAYGSGYNGMSGAWLDERISLDTVAGGPVLLRFEVITDDGVNRAGLAIDDIAIDAIGFADDFEGSCAGWTAEGWRVVHNAVPATAWLQTVQLEGSAVRAVDRWLVTAADDSGLMTHQITVRPQSGVTGVILALSPMAVLTTEPVPYALTIEPAE